MLQGIGKDIVEAKHPRALGGTREDRRLELLDLVAPLLVKSARKCFAVVLCGLAYERGIIPNKINYSVNVSVEPTAAVLINKRGKLAIVLPKVRSVLPLLFRGGFFSVGSIATSFPRLWTRTAAVGSTDTFTVLLTL